MSAVRSLSHLKAAAALISCSLASAEAAAQLGMPPLQFTTVNSFTITMTAGSATFTYTKSGPNTGFFYNGHTSSGMSAATHAAAGNTSGYDLFAAFIDPIPSLTIATGTGTASLTFSADVVFTDVGFMMNGISSGWRYGGAAVNDGDVFRASASPYVFDINYYYFGPGISDGFDSYVSFSAATSSGVPLPGAAGLAAVGLVGLRGRRRR